MSKEKTLRISEETEVMQATGVPAQETEEVSTALATEIIADLKKQLEEAKEEAGNLDILMNNFWIGVKENHDPEALHEELTGIYKTALDLAVEAIQTAAMARKGIISSIDLRAVDQCLSETERRGEL